jgi:hypothetical protein
VIRTPEEIRETVLAKMLEAPETRVRPPEDAIEVLVAVIAAIDAAASNGLAADGAVSYARRLVAWIGAPPGSFPELWR